MVSCHGPLGYYYVACPPAESPSKTQPPSNIQAGIETMSPPAHTIIHVIYRWENKAKGTPMKFKIFKVPTMFTVQDLITGLEGKDHHAAVEYKELGDGQWSKDLTIPYKDDKAKKRLADIGWGEHKGKGSAPTWMTLEKC
jgi:hypothetical protein